MLESKRKAIIFFLIALVLALISGFLVLKKVQALNSNLGTIVDIYVANKDISSRAIITPDDITTSQIPKKYLRDEHVTNIDELINKVSVVPLSKGEIFTKSILKEASAVTEADNRLITLLRSERVFFDVPLIPLDRVDIVVSHQFKDEPEPVTEIFMEDVKVAQTASNKEGFNGVRIEVPYEKVPALIHMQNYADSIRIVKANVGQLARIEKAVKNQDKEVPEQNASNQNSENQKVEKEAEQEKKNESVKKEMAKDESKGKSKDDESKE